MREIKFRGLSLDDGDFWTGYYIYSEYENIHYISSNAVIHGNMNQFVGLAHFTRVDPETVGQFTGLKDKNGKEIYEGHILKYKFWSATKVWWKDLQHKKEIDEYFEEQKKDIKEHKGAIEFYDGCFKFRSDIHSFYLHQWSHDLRIYEDHNFHGGDSTCELFDFEIIGNIHENPELL